MGALEAVRALVDGGAEVNRQNREANDTSALLAACHAQQWEVADFLVEQAGADPWPRAGDGRTGSDLAESVVQMAREKRKQVAELPRETMR